MRYCIINCRNKSIVLIGMMGAGKSSVGRCLQLRTKLALVDIDDVVASHIGTSIPEIFSKYGEQVFREIETQALREMAPAKQTIIVTGGGIDRVAEINPVDLIEWAAEWKRVVGTPVFDSAAEAHKRAKKIVEAEWESFEGRMAREEQVKTLSQPAELDLRKSLDRVDAEIQQSLASRQPRKAIEAIASIQPAISRFFDEVRVVVPEPALKNARLSLLMDFSDAVSRFGDPSVFAQKQA